MKLRFRKAVESDLITLVNLLADDELGSKREDTSLPVNQHYLDALLSINKDPNNELTIAECDGALVGMLQLTFIPYLTYTGSWRCLIEGVRIASNFRGQGVGTELINWAIQRAKRKQCSLVQLTSDKQRRGSLKFYEALGFQASHEGFKLKI